MDRTEGWPAGLYLAAYRCEPSRMWTLRFLASPATTSWWRLSAGRTDGAARAGSGGVSAPHVNSRHPVRVALRRSAGGGWISPDAGGARPLECLLVSLDRGGTELSLPPAVPRDAARGAAPANRGASPSYTRAPALGSRSGAISPPPSGTRFRLETPSGPAHCCGATRTHTSGTAAIRRCRAGSTTSPTTSSPTCLRLQPYPRPAAWQAATVTWRATGCRPPSVDSPDAVDRATRV